MNTAEQIDQVVKAIDLACSIPGMSFVTSNASDHNYCNGVEHCQEADVYVQALEWMYTQNCTQDLSDIVNMH